MAVSVNLECVRPVEEHARLVMKWRNDPHTLAMSNDQTPKIWESFFLEFTSTYFTTPGLPPLFAIDEGRRTAFVRFRPDSLHGHPRRSVAEISIIVAPDSRGEGYGREVLIEAAAFARRQGYDSIVGDIKKQNVASIKIFQRAGYEELEKRSVGGEEGVRMVFHLTPVDLSDRGVFVIAEAGSNWRQGTPARDWAMAKALVDVAVEAGADAVKFQTYRPETVYVENAGSSDYLSDAGLKEDIRAIFHDLTMPPEMVGKIAEYSAAQGIEFMSSYFSEEDFALVDPHVQTHKIASYEISHIRLIELAAKSGKHLIMSTGASQEEDIQWAVDTFYKNGGSHLTLLQCTAKYPAGLVDANIGVIPWLRRRFQVDSGLSDHTRDPIIAPAAAVALGAKVIEKHYTLDNRLPGPDHSFALTPSELKRMVDAIRDTEKAIGTGIKKVEEAEEELRYYARRGVQAIQRIKAGEILEEGVNIAILRPGQQPLGVHSKYLDEMEGKPAKNEIGLGEGVQIGDW